MANIQNDKSNFGNSLEVPLQKSHYMPKRVSYMDINLDFSDEKFLNESETEISNYNQVFFLVLEYFYYFFGIFVYKFSWQRKVSLEKSRWNLP